MGGDASGFRGGLKESSHDEVEGKEASMCVGLGSLPPRVTFCWGGGRDDGCGGGRRRTVDAAASVARPSLMNERS